MNETKPRRSLEMTVDYAEMKFGSPTDELEYVRQVINAYCAEQAADAHHDITTFLQLVPLLTVAKPPAYLKEHSEHYRKKWEVDEANRS